MIAQFHRTFINPDPHPNVMPPTDWLWEPWEYTLTGPEDLFHRTDPERPGSTMCGLRSRALIGNPSAWSRRPHCDCCSAAPGPAPREGYLVEFARYRRLADGRRVDVVSIQHTGEPEPFVWELLPHDPSLHRSVPDVVSELGWRLVGETHVDPRTDTTRGWAEPPGPVQSSLF